MKASTDPNWAFRTAVTGHDDRIGTCRSRRHISEAAALRALWAIRLNGRLGDRFDVKYCNLCHSWHITRGRR